MDPELDDMVIDITYEVHGVPVRFDPGPASDVLVCLHQPQGQQPAAATLEFSSVGLSVAEAFLTVLVRVSSFASPDTPQPSEGAEVRFQRGRLAGKVYRLGQDPAEHGAGAELRLTLQKVS